MPRGNVSHDENDDEGKEIVVGLCSRKEKELVMFKPHLSFASILAFALVFPMLSVAAGDSYRALSVVRIPSTPAADFSLKRIGGERAKLSD